jgi:hypothetical protein
VPAVWKHIDARRFRPLFLQNPNIRLSLMGILIRRDLTLPGVQYFTNGAVLATGGRSYLDSASLCAGHLIEDGSAL